MGYKIDKQEISKQVIYLRRRFNFKGLLHFTDFSNLEQIFKEGYLYSRNQCAKRNIQFVDGAEPAVLDKAPNHVHSCVRFYYRGKSPTLYNNEGIKLKAYCNTVHIPTPVYLLFDEELIYLDYTEFSNGNATNSDIGHTSEFFNSMDWGAIFHDTWFEPEERDYIVNKRQAELLSTKPIHLSYLKEIIFRCNADKKRAINKFGNDKRYRVDSSLFSDKNFKNVRNECEKNNFIKDYKIRFENDKNGRENKVILEIECNKPWKEYQRNFKILDYNNNGINDYEKEIYYKDIFGLKINESVNGDEIIILVLKGDIQKWNKLILYVNNYICIEEYLIKYDIEEYDVKIIKEKSEKILNLYIKFKNIRFNKYEHRYEILDRGNNVINSGYINYKEYTSELGCNLTIKNIKDNWAKIKYYMNNVLCISQDIDENEINMPF